MVKTATSFGLSEEETTRTTSSARCTGMPSIATITSPPVTRFWMPRTLTSWLPPRRPALAAGLPGLTSTTNAPWSTFEPTARAIDGVMSSVVIPT